jgi:hypothetical protein
MHIMRISSVGSGWRAMVRHFQRHAVNISKVEQRLRWGGINFRRADISEGPKKKERWAISSSGIIVPLVSATSSYSRCMHVTRGGFLAFRTCLSHTAGTEGVVAPRAISPTAAMNWPMPEASLMVWLRRRPKIKPPHLRRVTCHFA